MRQPMATHGFPTTGQLMVAGATIVYAKNLATDPVWWLGYAFTGSLGIWWLLGWHGRRHGGRLWWLLVPVFAQFAVGGDWSRFALYAFPVVVPAGAIAVWRHPRRRVLLALVGAQSLAVVADLVVIGNPGINSTQPSMYVTVPLIVLTAAMLWLPRVNRAASASPNPGRDRAVRRG
ncbi:MAG TPA: hypothetical protein VFE14_07310 [Micromonosporaceae bacterium]|nr:hypothetical protein [Micromonosporaceae bacterium]